LIHLAVKRAKLHSRLPLFLGAKADRRHASGLPRYNKPHFSDRPLLICKPTENLASDILLPKLTRVWACFCLTSATLFISAGGDVSGIWSPTDSQLTLANTSAS
jgi:hypothetical protein